MKNKFTTILLTFVLLILLGAIVLFGKTIYNELMGEESEPLVYKVGEILTEEPDDGKTTNSSETSSEPIKISISNNVKESSNTTITKSTEITNNMYFYDQLNENQKIIYNGLNNSKQNLKQGNYVINFGSAFSNMLSQENGSDILGDDYQAAIEAFTHDNPEIFYLDVNKMYLNIETTTKLFKTTYNVYISAAQGSTYLSNEFSNTEQIESAISQIEQVKATVMNGLKGSDYQNILFIHDYLVNSIEYDSDYTATGSYTIYGALIGKKCVCEGYAKAFKYLANSAGFQCEIMQGTATNSSGQTESHAWNCIKLNETWYEVDPTWDDPIVIGGNGRATNEMRYRYFLKGTSTFGKDHVLSYQFSDGGKNFSYPTISVTDY